MSKQRNPMERSNQENQASKFQYIPSRHTSSEVDIFETNKTQTENNLQSSNNTRSTLPLNPFYGEAIGYIKNRRFDKISEILEECPHQFYDGVDEMHKTILH